MFWQTIKWNQVSDFHSIWLFLTKNIKKTVALRWSYVFIDSSLYLNPLQFIIKINFIRFKHSVRYSVKHVAELCRLSHIRRKKTCQFRHYTEKWIMVSVILFKNHIRFVYHAHVAYFTRVLSPADVFHSDWWYRQSFKQQHKLITKWLQE